MVIVHCLKGGVSQLCGAVCRPAKVGFRIKTPSRYKHRGLTLELTQCLSYQLTVLAGNHLGFALDAKPGQAGVNLRDKARLRQCLMKQNT